MFLSFIVITNGFYTVACSVTTDYVLSEFSMFGGKKKRSFTDLKVFKLVLGEYRLERLTLLAKPGNDLSTQN